MGEKIRFEQMELPPTDSIVLGSTADKLAEKPIKENALSYACHVLGVLAIDNQLESRLDEVGRFVPFDFMEEQLTPLVSGYSPLTNADVWQLALELHRALEAMPEVSEDEASGYFIAA